MARVMNILFITSTRIGDSVLSTGLLDHLISQYPDARITVACGPEAAPLFEAVPNLRRVIVIEKKPFAGHWLGLWAGCAPQYWSLVVDLRASLIAWFLLAGERRVLKTDAALVHRVRRLSELFGLSEPRAPRLWTAPRHEEAAKRLVPNGGPVLALGPTANWRAKQWRAENFKELAARLTAPGGLLPGARVAVFGVASERPDSAPVIEAIPPERMIDLVGEVDLLTAFACLKRCALFVGNDSGLMHLAAAAIPTVGLFGPSRVEHYAPWGQHTEVARTAIPFDDLFPPDFDYRTTGTLMDSLGVDAAEAAVRALWERCGGARS